jgi:hypothetical protein
MPNDAALNKGNERLECPSTARGFCCASSGSSRRSATQRRPVRYAKFDLSVWHARRHTQPRRLLKPKVDRRFPTNVRVELQRQRHALLARRLDMVGLVETTRNLVATRF